MKIKMKILEKLNNKPFLSVYDVAQEIDGQLEWSDITMDNLIVVDIKNIGRFIDSDLMKFFPSDLIISKEEYKRLRYTAIEFLKDNDLLQINEFVADLSYESIPVLVDKEKFSKFYREISKIYENKVALLKKNGYEGNWLDIDQNYKERLQEEKADSDRRENNRLKKIKESGLDQLGYALQKTIEKAILHKDYFDVNRNILGFEEATNGILDLRAFVSLLKEKRCCEDFEELDNGDLRVKNANIDKLNIFKEELSNSRSKNTPKDSLISTPVGTKWSDVNIKWINGNDVKITLNNNEKFEVVKDYKELGFYDEKRRCPNILWKILSNAASFGGKMAWNNLGGVSDADKHKKIDAFQKQISLLRCKLKNIFGNLQGQKNAPFIPYSIDKEYVITLNLIAEKSSKKQEKESWRELMPEAELSNFDRIEKTAFIKNPNQILEAEDDY